MADKEYISYNTIVEDTRELAEKLIPYGFNKIIAVTRGGMIPACLIAQFLNIKEISSIALASYDDENKSGEIKLLVCPDIEIDEKTLFVDDLFDTGNTYRYIKQKYPQAKIAVVYTKDQNAQLDFSAKQKQAEIWLVFPWEFEPV